MASSLIAISTAQTHYFPPAGAWAKKAPADVGMDAAKLDAAIAFAKTKETTWPKDFSTQEKIFGSLLGPIPKERASTNGLIIRHGYIVGEFGDTSDPDPTYSVAKSMLATVAGIAVREKLITNLDQPVGATVHDGGYDSAHNAPVTWRQHLQQETEWEGEMWGKKHDFVGTVAFGDGERKPRALQAPGTFYEYNDVRINRFSLSMLRLFKKPIPEVFRDEVMNVIGASNTWQWIPYDNSYLEIDGKKMPSVSGGTRWGSGVWINAQDMARFGYLWLRGGRWGNRQIIPPDYVKAALTPSAHGPDYGFLWWLNTQGKSMAGLPTNAFEARGAGSNTIFVSPNHDLVVVWRWHSNASAEFFKMVVDAIQPASTAR
ncbi:MAG: serine hydrolase domain-containing protein [Vicinamibacterales bacterium]